MIGPTRSPLAGMLAGVLVFAVVASSAAAPSGPPIRIGGTLALTGPLAPTAIIHKIAGEISVDELNRANGLLGRPVEWVLLDDQSKPDLTRSLYERLITVDKVDLLIGPYATSAILAEMGVAQRYQKMLVHHSFGMPHLAKYESLDDSTLAQWLRRNRVETLLGKLRFDGPNNFGDDLSKLKQVQEGKWVVVWPREFAAPGARLLPP